MSKKSMRIPRLNMKYHSRLREMLVFAGLLLVFLLVARFTGLLAFASPKELQDAIPLLPEFLFKFIRLDLRLIATLLLLFVCLPLLGSYFIPERWFSAYVRTVLKILLILVIFLQFLSAGYLFFYQHPIDVTIFDLFEDDTYAVLASIVAQPVLIALFSGFLLTSFIAVWLFAKNTRVLKPLQPDQYRHPVKQLGLWLMLFLLLLILARSSLRSWGMARMESSVGNHKLLDIFVRSAATNTYYLFRDKDISNQAFFQRDIIQQHNDLDSLQQLKQKAGYDSTGPLIRTTPKNTLLEQVRPHVILVLMEGWSSHIARKHSSVNNVLGEFSRHAAADHFYPQFFPSTYLTHSAIENLLLNTPITLSNSVARRVHFKHSNAMPFKQKNYQTLFLSGGYSGWRQQNDFWLRQGFDQFIGRSTIERALQVESDHIWGTYDEYLFQYLEQHLKRVDSSGQSLFSFVLTTNNHSPIRLPQSYKHPVLDPSLYSASNDDDSEMVDEDKRLALAAYHYQTDQLGRFISRIKNSPLKNKVLIVAVGDHPLRDFSKNTEPRHQYVRYAVPAYFYVPESLDKLKGSSRWLAGSHSDLFPTLFELSLSEASYYNFGQPLMEKALSTAYGWWGWEERRFLFADGLFNSNLESFYPWSGAEKLYLKSQPQPLKQEQKRVIKIEKYRTILKKYLLIEDYQQQRVSINHEDQ